MTKESESAQNAGNGYLDDFATLLHAIIAEGADYTKKSVEARLARSEKLLGAKSFESVIQIQTEYAKIAYAEFVAQATKMRELHSSLAKAAFKPAEQAIAAMQGTIQGPMPWKSYSALSRSSHWICAQSVSRSNAVI